MKTNARFAVALTAVLALALASPAVACNVLTSLPATIDEPGKYCLERDFFLALDKGTAIRIDSDDVVLDFQGYLVSNRAAGLETGALGVAAYERNNITVRNGTLIGFYEGVSLSGPLGVQTSNNHLVEGMRVTSSTRTGIGINGMDCVVRGNVVYEVGVGGETGTGILLTGWRHKAVDNDVQRIVGSAGTGISYTSGGGNGLILGNRITGARYGVWISGSSARYRDNVTHETSTAYVGGVDLGNND
jgi:hypothetical protein